MKHDIDYYESLYENNSTGMFRRLFSASGRIRRTEFILTIILSYGALFGIAFLLDSYKNGWKTNDFHTAFSLLSIPIFVIIILQKIKRFHDIGWSGWWCLCPVITWICPLFFPGDHGINDYGSNPHRNYEEQIEELEAQEEEYNQRYNVIEEQSSATLVSKRENDPSKEMQEQDSPTEVNDQTETDNQDDIMRDPDTGLPIDVDGEIIYNREWLKSNTRFGGWMILFTVLLVFGIVGTIIDVNELSVYLNYNRMHGFVVAQMIASFVSIGMAIYIIYAFYTRRPNAVFYARAYCILSLSSHFLLLVTRLYDQTTFGLVINTAWLVFLYYSENVKEMIPPSYRKVTPIDWGIVTVAALAIFIPIVSLITIKP